jgi:hypothetical protein
MEWKIHWWIYLVIWCINWAQFCKLNIEKRFMKLICNMIGLMTWKWLSSLIFWFSSYVDAKKLIRLFKTVGIAFYTSNLTNLTKITTRKWNRLKNSLTRFWNWFNWIIWATSKTSKIELNIQPLNTFYHFAQQ